MNSQNTPVIFRFDVFKGKKGKDGKIEKIRSVGTAWHENGKDVAEIKLKTFPNMRFYLLHESIDSEMDFMLATREPSKNPERQYFWNIIGNGQMLSEPNGSLIALKWDLFDTNDIYIDLPSLSVVDQNRQNFSTKDRPEFPVAS